jgi:signal peptidase I
LEKRKKSALPKRSATKQAVADKGKLTVWPLYIILALLFVLYLLYQKIAFLSLVFGIAIFFLLVVIIALEFVSGAHDEGYKKMLIEIFAAIAIVAAIWLLLSSYMHTAYPVDVVPSCSMLPYLHRGDLIFVHGIENISQIRAPMLNITRAQASIMVNSNSESLECVAYRYYDGGLEVSQIIKPGYSIGLYSSSGSQLVQYNQQSQPVTYTCGARAVKYSNGTLANEAYLTSITVDNITISGDRNNSIIVYKTMPGDLFYNEGDSYVVHRVYAILNASGQYYVLTKGDNNPGLDMQYFNHPAPIGNVIGKVVGAVPYIGYIKLILDGNMAQPQGCNYTILHP